MQTSSSVDGSPLAEKSLGLHSPPLHIVSICFTSQGKFPDLHCMRRGGMVWNGTRVRHTVPYNGGKEKMYYMSLKFGC